VIRVAFVGCNEIRMGSPFSSCRLWLSGEWVPQELGAVSDWIEVKAYSADGRLLALARWDTEGNVPGFRIWLVDMENRKAGASERLAGCCRELEFRGEKLIWRAFPDLEGELDLHGLG